MQALSLSWPWLTLAALGAFHGLNPAMGWLFAVALGLQERRWQAVGIALGPIALGHALAIALVAIPVGLLGLVIPPRWLLILGGFVLIGFAVWKIVTRFRHPRWVGMRVGPRDLMLWSFLMATAHGSGLMLAPAVALLTASTPVAAAGLHADHLGHVEHAAGDGLDAALAPAVVGTVLHTGSMLMVMGIIALIVYRVLGVELLRRAWINLDLIWAGALVLAGGAAVGLGVWSPPGL